MDSVRAGQGVLFVSRDNIHQVFAHPCLAALGGFGGLRRVFCLGSAAVPIPTLTIPVLPSVPQIWNPRSSNGAQAAPTQSCYSIYPAPNQSLALFVCTVSLWLYNL